MIWRAEPWIPQDIWSARLLVMMADQDGRPIEEDLRWIAALPAPGDTHKGPWTYSPKPCFWSRFKRAAR